LKGGLKMAIPRVFISSTYYDLKYIRNDIGDFIVSLGYDAVMHDRGNVAYTQSESLESSCYNELSTCDIVVCIIGNKYGTQSSNSDYSITMEELNKAIKDKKKIYVYIAKDVFLENATYLANKDNGVFKPVYTDDIRIHEYISQIKENIKNNPILSFDTVTEIVDNLRKQFAGIFQYLLTQEATLTESKTYYDLQDTADKINELINDFEKDKTIFFSKFDNSIYAANHLLKLVGNILGLKNSTFFADNRDSIIEVIELCGFRYEEDIFCGFALFTKFIGNKKMLLKINEDVFDTDGTLKIYRNTKSAEQMISVEETIIENDDDLPF
jgi:hypothetical protein